MRGHVGHRNNAVVKKFGIKRSATSKRFGSKSFTMAHAAARPAVRNHESLEKASITRGGPVREMPRAIAHRNQHGMGLEKRPGAVRDGFEHNNHAVNSTEHKMMKLSMNN